MLELVGFCGKTALWYEIPLLDRYFITGNSGSIPAGSGVIEVAVVLFRLV